MSALSLYGDIYDEADENHKLMLDQRLMNVKELPHEEKKRILSDMSINYDHGPMNT